MNISGLPNLKVWANVVEFRCMAIVLLDFALRAFDGENDV